MPSVEVKRRLFSVRETSIITGRSVPSVWRDIAEGRLESVLICGSRKVKGESIDRMCADGSPAPKPGRPRKAEPPAAEPGKTSSTPKKKTKRSRKKEG